MGAYIRKRLRRHQGGRRARVRPLSAAQGAPPADRRDAVRRRAADARDGARDDVAPEAAAAGRAVDGPRAAHGAEGVRDDHRRLVGRRHDPARRAEREARARGQPSRLRDGVGRDHARGRRASRCCTIPRCARRTSARPRKAHPARRDDEPLASQTPSRDPRSVAPNRAIAWFGEAMRLWKRGPLAFSVMAVVVIVDASSRWTGARSRDSWRRTCLLRSSPAACCTQAWPPTAAAGRASRISSWSFAAPPRAQARDRRRRPRRHARRERRRMVRSPASTCSAARRPARSARLGHRDRCTRRSRSSRCRSRSCRWPRCSTASAAAARSRRRCAHSRVNVRPMLALGGYSSCC